MINFIIDRHNRYTVVKLTMVVAIALLILFSIKLILIRHDDMPISDTYDLEIELVNNKINHSKDSILNVTIKNFSKNEQNVSLTYEMVMRSKMEWKWFETPPKNFENEEWKGIGASSPRYGCILSYHGTNEERGIPVKLPVQIKFNINQTFLDNTLGVVHCGEYTIRLVIPTFGRVLKSNDFKVVIE